MKHLIKILPSVWIISGIATGTGYAYVRSSRSAREIKAVHFSQGHQDLKAAHGNCYQTNLEQALECENEVEDDSEKTVFEESSNPSHRFGISVAPRQKTLNGRFRRVRSLNILYCVYRI